MSPSPSLHQRQVGRRQVGPGAGEERVDLHELVDANATAPLGEPPSSIPGLHREVGSREARRQFRQERLWRDEAHARRLITDGEVARVEGDDPTGLPDDRRCENRVIVWIAQHTVRAYRPIVHHNEDIREDVDQFIDALSVDDSVDTSADAVLHTDANQLADDEGTPDRLEVTETRQQPEPMAVGAEEYGCVEDRAKQGWIVWCRRQTRAPSRPSATRSAASSSETSSRSSAVRARQT
jgi:hypothetical protein